MLERSMIDCRAYNKAQTRTDCMALIVQRFMLAYACLSNRPAKRNAVKRKTTAPENLRLELELDSPEDELIEVEGAVAEASQTHYR